MQFYHLSHSVQELTEISKNNDKTVMTCFSDVLCKSLRKTSFLGYIRSFADQK